MNEINLRSTIYIKVNGETMDEGVGSNLMEVRVDQNAHLPGMFTIRLFDPRLTLLDGDLLEVGDAVEIGSYEPGGIPIRLIRGEVSGIEPIFGRNGAAELQVRGYDRSHKMHRSIRSHTYLNVKDCDLATRIAEQWGLTPAVDTTTTIYEHVYQRNQSDLDFLAKRAWRIGFECFVSDETLYFRRPKSVEKPDIVLTYGQDLLSFLPRMSSAEQVNEVIVRGWDTEHQKPIVGRARVGRLFAGVMGAPQTEQSRENHGNGVLTIVNRPVSTQAEADILAAARMDELSGVFVHAEGIAFRRPGIRAGEEVQLQGLGHRFSGNFLVTSARHVFSAKEGFETRFEIRGTRSSMMVAQMRGTRKQDRWHGIYTAVVTNNNDPLHSGRVKLRFPWLDDNGETNWVRVMTPGAGGQSGFFMPPSVNEQVFVAFEQGDFGCPIVLGAPARFVLDGATTGRSEEPQLSGSGGISENGRTTLTKWQSPGGSTITMHDSIADRRLELYTPSGHTVTLDETNGSLRLTSAGGQRITLDDRNSTIAIETPGRLSIHSDGNIDLNARGNVHIGATGSLDLRGLNVAVNGKPLA